MTFLRTLSNWLTSRKAEHLAEARRVVLQSYDEATKTPSKVIRQARQDLKQDLHQRLAGEIGREWGR